MSCQGDEESLQNIFRFISSQFLKQTCTENNGLYIPTKAEFHSV